MNWTTTFILGGGPSAGVVDTAPLRNRGVVLGVNDAAFHKPCDAFFSNDHRYALKIEDKIRAFPGERHLSIKPQHIKRFKHWPATIWTRLYENTPTLRLGCLASGGPEVPGCSGYVALNLVAQKGARRIVLIGYDFDTAYSYFFDQGPIDRVRIPDVIQSFRDVAPWYARQGIEIVNTNANSGIDAFPKAALEAA